MHELPAAPAAHFLLIIRVPKAVVLEVVRARFPEGRLSHGVKSRRRFSCWWM